MISAWLSLGTLALFGILAFGLRSLIQWRRTGSTGFRGLSGRFGSAEWSGGALLLVAFVLAIASPIAVLTSLDVVRLVPTVVLIAGATLVSAGILGTLYAQLAMGDSWRIGVDESERTALVSRGPFGVSRNPIFTSMLLFLLGLALVVPTVPGALAFITALVGVEVHVRLVEEPYLLRTHGLGYARYAAAVGRFLPLIGRLRPVAAD